MFYLVTTEIFTEIKEKKEQLNNNLLSRVMRKKTRTMKSPKRLMKDVRY